MLQIPPTKSNYFLATFQDAIRHAKAEDLLPPTRLSFLSSRYFTSLASLRAAAWLMIPNADIRRG